MVLYLRGGSVIGWREDTDRKQEVNRNAVFISAELVSAIEKSLMDGVSVEDISEVFGVTPYVIEIIRLRCVMEDFLSREDIAGIVKEPLLSSMLDRFSRWILNKSKVYGNTINQTIVRFSQTLDDISVQALSFKHSSKISKLKFLLRLYNNAITSKNISDIEKIFKKKYSKNSKVKFNDQNLTKQAEEYILKNLPNLDKIFSSILISRIKSGLQKVFQNKVHSQL